MRKWAETVPFTGALGERYLIERRGLNVKPLDLGMCCDGTCGTIAWSR